MLFTLQVLLPGFLACVMFTLLLSYLGLHVLAREVVFVDIALAQLAALGTAAAAYMGFEPHDHASLAWSLGFTIAGAAAFAVTRRFRSRVPQEAFIGITFAVAAAFSILIANALPHGDEELKETLIGSLLTVTYDDVAMVAAVFALAGALHGLWRHRFLALSHAAVNGGEAQLNGVVRDAALWDFIFYVIFGVVITVSVHLAGVLLVFSFLIVPAVFSALFSSRLGVRLMIGWGVGIVASAVGLWTSFEWDLPTGATVVIAFGATLVVGVVVHSNSNSSGAQSPNPHVRGVAGRDAIVHHGVIDAGTHFLAKPVTSADLTRKVREVLDEGTPPL